MSLDPTILAVVVGAVLAGISTWLTNWHLLRVQQRQWEREDEKAEREVRRQETEKVLEQKRQAEREILSNYAEAIAGLALLTRPGHDTKALAAIQLNLLSILASYPDNRSEAYLVFRSDVLEQGLDYHRDAAHIHNAFLRLMEEDRRLK